MALRRVEPGAREPAAGAIRSLLVGGWVLFVDEDTLGHEIGELLIAGVAQKQRLAAVADENEGVMGNSGFGHLGLSSREARFVRTDRVNRLHD